MRAKCAYYWQKMRLTYLSHFITRQSNGMIHRQWAWGNGVCVPSQEYCTNFYNRTLGFEK